VPGRSKASHLNAATQGHCAICPCPCRIRGCRFYWRVLSLTCVRNGRPLVGVVVCQNVELTAWQNLGSGRCQISRSAGPAGVYMPRAAHRHDVFCDDARVHAGRVGHEHAIFDRRARQDVLDTCETATRCYAGSARVQTDSPWRLLTAG
jgi:hypothetical protein